MKSLIKVIFLTFIVSILIVACNGIRKTDDTIPQYTIEDPVNENKPEQIKGRIIEDTIIGHWGA